MRRILHIVTSVDAGGAQNMLYKLLKCSNRDEYYHEVICLLGEGLFGKRMEDCGIRVHYLGLRRSNLRLSRLLPALRMVATIGKDFDLVDTWLYHADLVGFLVAKIFSRKRLIWNIRHCNLERGANKRTTLWLVKFNSWISKYVDCITYNSTRALDTHTDIGYTNNNSMIMPNGFELDVFKFDPRDRIKVREELSLGQDLKVIITVGRWTVQKDYPTLLKALSVLRQDHRPFRMILCGPGLDSTNDELMRLIHNDGLAEAVILLGQRTDIPRLLSAADLYVSSSLGESFSNSIGEAMAMELPCVVTDVGESKNIVGTTGLVVEPRDYVKLAEALAILMDPVASRDRGKMARRRVQDKFELNTVVRLFYTNYASLLQ